jgi:hypothetical protein
MDGMPEVTTPQRAQQRSAKQSVQPPRRPEWAGVDQDLSRRPGVPHMRTDPQPFPNTRFPPERQAGEPAVPKHNRPNKPFPPVFGTSTPLKGVSGAVRRAAYKLPDHYPSHWLLLMLGDRIESWGTRAKRVLPAAAAVALIGYIARR